jgi:DNA ligase (NAD+)
MVRWVKMLLKIFVLYRKIPLRIEPEEGSLDICPRVLEVRGEVYMARKDFDEFNENAVVEGYKPLANPRNAAAGALRSLDPAVVRRKRLSFYVYGVGEVVGWDLPKTHSDLIEKLIKFGHSSR